jgi:predicted DNA-binding transcriptional regulator AlpA
MKIGTLPNLTRVEAAAHLNISVSTLDRLARDGSGPGRLKIGQRRWVYPLAEVQRWQAQLVRSADSTKAA